MKIKLGLRIFFAGLMFLSFYLAVWNQNRLRECTSDTATAVLFAGEMSRENTDRILEEESNRENPLSILFWGEKEEARIENTEFFKTTQVTAVYTGGNPYLLFGSEAALDSEDLNGCLIDRQTALELFGSERVEGEKITFGERIYIVRKVIPEGRRLIVIQAYGGEQVLQLVTLAHQEGIEDSSLVNEFLGRNGLDGRYLEQSLLLGISEAAVRFLPFGMVLGILSLLFSSAWEAEKGQNIRMIWWAAAWCGCAAALWLFIRFVSVPREIIPTKWSDFDFWTQLIKSKQEAFLFFLQYARTRPQLQAVLYFVRCVGYSMAALILYFLCIRKKA